MDIWFCDQAVKILHQNCEQQQTVLKRFIQLVLAVIQKLLAIRN